jgi:hypothetical protein
MDLLIFGDERSTNCVSANFPASRNHRQYDERVSEQRRLIACATIHVFTSTLSFNDQKLEGPAANLNRANAPLDRMDGRIQSKTRVTVRFIAVRNPNVKVMNELAVKLLKPRNPWGSKSILLPISWA